jgi:hypothetical protein
MSLGGALAPSGSRPAILPAKVGHRQKEAKLNKILRTYFAKRPVFVAVTFVESFLGSLPVYGHAGTVHDAGPTPAAVTEDLDQAVIATLLPARSGFSPF